MKKRLRVAAAIVALSLTAITLAGPQEKDSKDAAKPAAPARAAFDRMKELSGDWVFANPEDPADANKVRVTYRVTSAGSAVIETLFPGDEHEMVTMYYMDGEDLVLTHYCAMANQPRMKLQAGAKPERIAFDFAGGDNIDPAKDTHMHSAVFEFAGDDRYDATWTTWAEGKDAGSHVFEMKRKKK